MNCLLIRKDGFVATHVAVPENQQQVRIAEFREFPWRSWKPGVATESDLSDHVERCFRFVTKTPRGVRIFEEE